MKILALDIGNVCVKIDFNNFARTLNIPAMPEAVKDLQRNLECGRITDEKPLFIALQTPAAVIRRAFSRRSTAY